MFELQSQDKHVLNIFSKYENVSRDFDVNESFQEFLMDDSKEYLERAITYYHRNKMGLTDHDIHNI